MHHKLKRIFLIRHGESTQNAKEITPDIFDGDAHLTALGCQQAYEAGVFLKNYIEQHNISLDNALLWESPYVRTEETSAEIRKNLRISKVYQDPRLIEKDFGEFNNVWYDDWKNVNPHAAEVMSVRSKSMRGKFFERPPQGDSPLDVYMRVSSFLETISRDDYETLFIVAHGVVIRVFLMRMFHYSLNWYFNAPKVPNCGIFLLERESKMLDRGCIHPANGIEPWKNHMQCMIDNGTLHKNWKD